jgi:P27 family predicted phage terminase small subunit
MPRGIMRCIMPGPRPQPTALKVLKGERAPSRGVPRWEPEAEPGPIDRPVYLVGLAAELWDTFAPELVRLRLVAPRSAWALGMFCESVANWMRAAELLRSTGPLIKGREGQIVTNPASREFARFAELSRRFGAELGMTAAAVASIGRNLDGSQRTDQLDPARLLTG